MILTHKTQDKIFKKAVKARLITINLVILKTDQCSSG